MSQIEKLGAFVGSRRYARDLVECELGSASVRTRPWWDSVPNNWTYEQQNVLIQGRRTTVGHSYRFKLDIK